METVFDRVLVLIPITLVVRYISDIDCDSVSFASIVHVYAAAKKSTGSDPKSGLLRP